MEERSLQQIKDRGEGLEFFEITVQPSATPLSTSERLFRTLVNTAS